LNAEAAARAKREKRRANEQKQRTIQRMQLRMTAPMEIGQELEDLTLRTGQEDMFDLGVAEKNVLTFDEEPESVDEEEEGAGASGWETEDGEDALDSEDEQEHRIGALEDDLDGMYDAYKTMRSERDAKFKVKEARKKNADREETWGGIKPTTRDSDESQSEDGSESEVGGWEEMQAARAQDSTSNISDESGDEEPLPHTGKKRKALQDDDGQEEPRPLKRVKTLLTNLRDPKSKSQAQLSRSTQLWFSQDVFAGLGNMEVDEEGPVEDTYTSPPLQQAQKQEKDQVWLFTLISLC
jgi:AdoMet-dependent rRNA methyltransferase SPB1